MRLDVQERAVGQVRVPGGQGAGEGAFVLAELEEEGHLYCFFWGVFVGCFVFVLCCLLCGGVVGGSGGGGGADKGREREREASLAPPSSL